MASLIPLNAKKILEPTPGDGNLVFAIKQAGFKVVYVSLKGGILQEKTHSILHWDVIKQEWKLLYSFLKSGLIKYYE